MNSEDLSAMEGTFFKPFQNCPICQSEEISFDLVIRYWEHPLKFSRCKKCETCFANPMPSDRLITQGNQALVRCYQKDRTFDHEFRDARQAYLRGKLLAKRISRWKPKGRLLDIGCYNGFLALGVKEHSQWDTEGLEISDDLSQFISSQLKIRCHNGTLESASLPSDHYDFIICHDLIEHINKPDLFLREIFRILKPGGRVQIITPNGIQDLAFARRAFRQNTPITMLLNHIIYFSPSSLRLGLTKAGFAPLRLYGYDIRHSLKDFGCFGMGKPGNISSGPSIKEGLSLPIKAELLEAWDSKRIDELRNHHKTSLLYGYFRFRIPEIFTIPVPPKLKIGHELYALAEKPVK